jgi:hypothetical protein
MLTPLSGLYAISVVLIRLELFLLSIRSRTRREMHIIVRMTDRMDRMRAVD